VSLDELITDVASALRSAATVVDACQAALDVVSRKREAMSAIVLRVRDHLRCVAATRSWHVFSSAPPGAGVVGRVVGSGQPALVSDITRDPDYIPLGPDVVLEICYPIPGPTGPYGALNFEFTDPVDVDWWTELAGRVAALLGARVTELGGTPAESRSEMLVRHALELATASNDADLLAHSLDAACAVTGMDTAVLLLIKPYGIEINIDLVNPTPLARRIADIPQERLAPFVTRAREYGASYSLGDPADHNASGFEALTSLGVRTLVAVPVGATAPDGGVLLVADTRVERPDAVTVNLLNLLAVQAFSSWQRIQTLAHLHRLAASDPLTGLRHQAAFSERLARAKAEETAVFAIDIDSFKTINDTYGHQAGDKALVDLAQALSIALRSEDELYRIGGDEFAAVVDVSRSEEAIGVADRLVSAARAVGQTISVGVAIRRDGEAAEETLSRADAALYIAKRSGRDGVRLAG
jgi:diguanylate cyclase (GGDEF)-like protein